MERRNFIKRAMLAAGAASLASTEGFAKTAEALLERENALENTTPFRKSIMWGTCGMEGTILKKCKAIKAAGFDGIEPNSHMDRNEIIDAMKATGLNASSVCNSKHWSLLMSHPDASVRKQGIEAQIVAMEDAKAYGTDAVLLVPGRADADTNYEDCWKRSTACIKELVPVAENMKVKICIENVWNNFLLSPIEMRTYIDQFESPWICSYFDCGNILNYGWPEHWIAVLGGRIGRIHIKEFSKTIADKEGRGKGFDVKLTEGEVNWKEVMKQLRSNYTGGWLTTEQGNSKDETELKDLSSRLDKILTMYNLM